MSANEFPIGEDVVSDGNYDAPRPEDFISWEKALDTSKRYKVFLTSGELRRRRPGEKHEGRLECKMEFRIAHDEKLPRELHVVQGKRVKCNLFTDGGWFETFCSGAQVDKHTFDPQNYPNLELMVKFKKRGWDRETTDPDTGVKKVEPAIMIEIDTDSVFRA